MTTAISARSVRAFNWPLVGFVVAHAAAILGTLALIPIFGSRLPPGTSDFATNELIWTLVPVAVVLILIALRRGDRSSFAQEIGLPLSLAFAGQGFFGLAGSVVINLDATSYRLVFDTPVGIAVLVSGLYMTYALGCYLGSTAAIMRLRRETASGHRFAWLTEVDVDRSWRLRNALVFGILAACLLVILLGFGHSPLFAGWILVCAGVGLVARHSISVFITDAGIRVSDGQLFGVPRWSLPLADIASARVVNARPSLGLNSGKCVRRTGPALEVKSTAGRSYLVSLPEAQEAASVLKRLVEQRSDSEH